MLSALILWEYSYPTMPEISDNWYTRDSPFQVLSYCGKIPSSIERMHRIETDNYVTLLRFLAERGHEHFCHALHIAMEFGLYLVRRHVGLWRIVSEVVESSISFEYLFFVVRGKLNTRSTIFLKPSKEIFIGNLSFCYLLIVRTQSFITQHSRDRISLLITFAK